jgi:hypothetical protein
MVGQKMAFLDPAFLLLGQFAKHLAQVLPKVPVQHLPTALGNKNNVVQSFPIQE